MDLSYLLFTAALAAVFAGAFNITVMSSLARLGSGSSDSWRPQTLGAQLASLTVHLFAGVGLGLLFWLSWGLAAVVGIPWWMRGILFATVIWGVSYLPALVIQLFALKMQWSIAAFMALESLITVMTVGIACGWAWSKGP
jgi:hypothetical protein